ncbi:MAG: hypothetical protein WDZ49_14630 [Litorilinea sp.]
MGFDSIWVHDRFMQVGEIGVWESYALLAALAAVTTRVEMRVEIGNLVTWFGYRSALIVADAIHTPATLSATHPFGPPILGPPAEIATSLHAFAAKSISHLQIAVTPQSPQGIEAFGDVLDALRTAQNR